MVAAAAGCAFVAEAVNWTGVGILIVIFWSRVIASFAGKGGNGGCSVGASGHGLLVLCAG